MRRLLLVLTVLTLAVVAAPTAVAAPATEFGGVRVGHVPVGLGASTDFDHAFDDVDFVSRVWESRRGDGWTVDLMIDVLRGARLHDATALHDFVIGYEQRPAAEVHYRRACVRGRPGWRTADEIFWLLRPGLGVVVRLDTGRWHPRELDRTAESVRALDRRVSRSR